MHHSPRKTNPTANLYPYCIGALSIKARGRWPTTHLYQQEIMVSFDVQVKYLRSCDVEDRAHLSGQ